MHLSQPQMHLRQIQLHLRQPQLHLRDPQMYFRQTQLHLRQLQTYLRQLGSLRYIWEVSAAFEEASFTFEAEVSYFLKPATNARN
jgi:hypothetical protein